MLLLMLRNNFLFPTGTCRSPQGTVVPKVRCFRWVAMGKYGVENDQPMYRKPSFGRSTIVLKVSNQKIRLMHVNQIFLPMYRSSHNPEHVILK